MTEKIIKEIKEEITKSDMTVKAIIKEIWECDLTSEELNQLNMLIAKQMLTHKTAIDNLEKLVKEIDKTCQRMSMQSEVNAFRHQLEINSISLRKANAACQKSIVNKSRNVLLNSSSSESNLKNRTTKSDKDSLVQQSSLVTENMRSVSRLLAEQVNQSEQTLQRLINSSAIATEAQEEFRTMGNIIVYSKKLLTKYGRREVTDKVLIFLALAFFFACVLYVIMKRLF